MDHLSGAAAARQTAAGEKIAQLEEANAELLAANAALEQQVRATQKPKPAPPRGDGAWLAAIVVVVAVVPDR